MKGEVQEILLKHIRLWNLSPDGDSFLTHSSLLQPVHFHNIPAMLKIPFTDEERRGSKLLAWWDGIGAVKVLQADDEVILMERLTGIHSLKTMSQNKQDDEATRIICGVIALLHFRRNKSLPCLTPLNIWFNDLFETASNHGDIFLRAARIAKGLLENQREIVALHGDFIMIIFSFLMKEDGWPLTPRD